MVNGAGGGGTAAGRGGMSVGALLFLALLLFFITTTPFADLNGASHADPHAGDSNIVNQIAALVLTAALAAYGLRHPLARDAVFQPRALLIPPFLWFVLVSAVSASPDVALRKVPLAAMTCINASVSLETVFFESGDPAAQLDDMMDAAEAGEAYTLVSGLGDVWDTYRLEQVGDKQSHIGPGGEASKIETSFKFRRLADPSSQVLTAWPAGWRMSRFTRHAPT